MTHLLITMAGAFLGTIAAAALLSIYGSGTGSPMSAAAVSTPRSRRVALAAAGAFAIVASLIFYFVSTGEMHAGLGAIAAVVTLAVLAFLTRGLR
jgi:hypothetical protein